MSQSIGSLSATACTHHACGWRLRRTTYLNGKRKQNAVPTTAWAALGFTDSMTLEQAKVLAKQLNGENAIKRKEQQSLAGIAIRVERDRLAHSVFMPEDRNLAFLKWLEENTSGKEGYIKKQKSIWGTVKKAIIGLQLLPDNFANNRKKIYRYIANNEYAPSYAIKQISMMNQYGQFCARITGKWYEAIVSPKGIDREMISDAYLDSEGYLGASEHMDLDMLKHLRKQLSEKQFNWVHATTWLGLRPSELDEVLEDRKMSSVWRIEQGEVDVLWVYQSKLTSKPRHERWKGIPLLYPEQIRALETLMKADAEAPLTKTLKSKTGGNYTKYTGRKGFCDIMLDLGQDLNHISDWMGHTNPRRTIESYKNKNVVRFTEVVSKKDT